MAHRTAGKVHPYRTWRVFPCLLQGQRRVTDQQHRIKLSQQRGGVATGHKRQVKFGGQCNGGAGIRCGGPEYAQG